MAHKYKQHFLTKVRTKVSGSEAIQFSLIGMLFSFILTVLYFLASFLSEDKVGSVHIIYQMIHIIIIGLMAWIVMRLFRIISTKIFMAKTKKHIPRFIITFFNWFIIIVALLFVTMSIFGQSAAALLTAGGLVSAGLAFSIKGIILDMISGLILDVERSYKTGDWIKLDGDIIGKVVNTTWRHVEVETEYYTSIIIPNSHLISDTYENLSQNNHTYAEHIKVSINHEIPVERAERILTDALLSIKEVVESGIHIAYAEGSNEGGMIYTLRYGVKEYFNFRVMRHRVLNAVTSKLHRSGLQISDTIGEYSFSKALVFAEIDELPVSKVLKKVGLFKALNNIEIEKLAKTAKRYLFDIGDDIIIKGEDTDSLFVIAEGVVDIIIPLKRGGDKKEQTVASLGEGNFVGDRALLLGEERSATVRARTKVLAYEVTKKSFQPILKARPEIIHDLSEIIIKREADTAQKMKKVMSRKKASSLKDDLITGMKKFFDVYDG